jgi:hypothetical protein
MDHSSPKFLQVQLSHKNVSIDEFVAASRIYRELWTVTELVSATCEMVFSRKYYEELWSSRETIESQRDLSKRPKNIKTTVLILILLMNISLSS